MSLFDRAGDAGAARELFMLNRELAVQMISLASQTGDVRPLIQAVQSLHNASICYSADTTPLENAQVRQLMADTLLKVGQANNNLEAVSTAITAYRDAITLASMLGDQKLRSTLKSQYSQARRLVENQETVVSMKGAA